MWHGRLFLSPGRLLYAGPVGTTAAHAHHAFQIVLPLAGSVLLRSAADREPVPCHHAAIPPDAPHAIEAPAESVLVLYVDPDGAVGRLLRRLDIPSEPAASWSSAGEPLAAARPVALPTTFEEADALATRVLERLAGEIARPVAVHPAVARLLRLLPDLLDEDVRAPALASRVGLSSGRLTHLFGAEVGIPLRPYVLWLRMQRAMQALQAGRSLTTAAHEGGFADAPHLTRVFRRMFGITPSEVMGFVEWVTPGPVRAWVESRGRLGK